MSAPREQLDALLASLDERVVVADGFDDALIGVADVFCGHSHSLRAVYDRAKCLKVLIDRDGMTEDEAEEFFAFNVEGSVIPGGPVYVTLLPTSS
jgi:hypothetical protein